MSSGLLAALSRFLASPLGEQPLSEAERTALRTACLEVCSRLETPGEQAGTCKRPRDCERLEQREISALDQCDASAPAPHGELVLLGSGLKAMAHLTREAMVHLRAADVVFGALQPGGPDRRWLELAIGRPLIDLNQFYPAEADDDRRAAYVQGAEAVMREVRRGKRVAVVEYGHPTVCVAMSEVLLRGARAEGHRVSVLPGVSCLAALWADLGVDPSHGCLVCTADALLGSPSLRAALGPALPHAALLMAEAVGDRGTGAKLASGRRSLADSAAWLELLDVLQASYGDGARCVLHRAPQWASVGEASLLSVRCAAPPLCHLHRPLLCSPTSTALSPLPPPSALRQVPLASLRCRSCVDGLLRAWGGDLGTLYLHGAADGGGGDAADGGVADGVGGGAVVARGEVEGAGEGYDARQLGWLQRWAIFDVKLAAWRRAARPTHHGMVSPRGAAVPPASGWALGAPPRAEAAFDAPTLKRLRAEATPAEAAAAEGGCGGGGYLGARAAWEPSDAAVRLQLAYAACARADAPAAVGALAARLGEGWEAMAAATQHASALYGQLGLPESGADALWGKPAAAPGRLEAKGEVAPLPFEPQSAFEWGE